MNKQGPAKEEEREQYKKKERSTATEPWPEFEDTFFAADRQIQPEDSNKDCD